MINRRLRVRLIRLIFLFATLGLIVFSLFYFIKAFKNNFSDSLVSPFLKQTDRSLEKIVKSSLDGAKGTYGIFIKNLKTDEFYSQDEHRIFESGSLYKIWVMAESFNQIKNGSLKDTEVLSQDVGVLNDKFNIASEEAELADGTISLTVDDAIKQMITISHNYAGLLLTEKIKLSNVAKFLKGNGFNESTVGISGDSPKTTPYDIALFFEKLYKGQLADSEDTNKMLDLLKKQQLNNKLPRYLLEGTIVAHKTGEIHYLTHDGGIVFTNKGDYIIVVMSESNLPTGAEERIARLSEAIFKYFTD